jgi:hypothetical protein
MNIMQQAIFAKARAYSKQGDREKTQKRAEELRQESDDASKRVREPKAPLRVRGLTQSSL